MLVVVAADTSDAAEVVDHLRQAGAAEVTESAVGGERVLVYGAPFDNRSAVEVAARLRVEGWPADVRPDCGGHLAAWHSHTRPVHIANRLTVCFPWSEFDRDHHANVIEIDPGGAFGTGAHPTTKLLLEELATRLQGGERVLDVGCGTGVLAIAAARLGAGDVTAIDVSQEAVAVATRNATRNKVQIEVSGRPLNDLTGPFDLIVANIHQATLIEMASSIPRLLAKQGWLGLSGLSPAQVSKVEAAYHDLTITRTSEIEDWAALELRRTDVPPSIRSNSGGD